MRQDIADKIATLPHAPGVYIMKDAKGVVFYIGKAKSLRDRVRSNFSGSDTRAIVSLHDRMLAELEVVLTTNEKEALLVENELIKEHTPRFNVALKDDKRFLCIRLDLRERYPRLQVVRRFGKDGARYFGPYHSAHALREVVRLVNRHFQLRTCNDQVLNNRSRPCLQHQIKRCPAPCVFDLSKGEYTMNVATVVSFLEGKETELVGTLTERMKDRARDEQFESAALIRDQMQAIQRSLERQKIVTSDFVNRDVVGIYREGPHVEIHTMRTRDGRLVDAQRFSFSDLEQPVSEILSDFATRYYTAAEDVPDEILFPLEMEWEGPLAEFLTEKRGRKVAVLTPQRGDKVHLVELANRNAHQAYMDKQREAGAARTAVERLQRALHLRRAPARIECFDISHFQGGQIVASLVRFDNGLPCKELYRRYRIRTTAGQDDFKSMYEVVSRRARRGLEEEDLPDLIVIDGGKGQLAAARAALDDHAVDGVDLISLAKSRAEDTPKGKLKKKKAENAKLDETDRAVLEAASDDLAAAQAVSEIDADGLSAMAEQDNTPLDDAVIDDELLLEEPLGEGDDASDIDSETERSAERVFLFGQKNPIVLRQNSAELFLLTRARDEAHRFAITYHRELRGKAGTRTALDAVAGIGPKRRKLLLRTFGSITRIKAAAFDDVAKVVGEATAKRVFEGLGVARDNTTGQSTN
ncbi:MAG: excinuclease ABC subunit UvrC [Clostridia bacterium]|nr:excinuclease ABC subunit UvrC [Deltaproteobacteria bacterium]